MSFVVNYLLEAPASLFARIQMAKTSYQMGALSKEDFCYLLGRYWERAKQ